MKKQKAASYTLTAAERKILDSHKTTMEGLAAYFGEAFEFVLHDVTDYDHSVIKIINGSHSGRKEGAPMTDLALSLLEQIQSDEVARPSVCYTSKSKYGRPVRSTTIVIYGEKQRVIGLLCINLYLDSPLSSLLQNFSLVPQSDYITENFSSDSVELIARALEKVKNDVASDDSVPGHLKNKEIVTILYHQGIFRLKDAVLAISADLGISKNTVYLHIRGLEEKGNL
ncbi:MAG: PAS domain-containing protein [Treponema sp.]|nr:PAS domain-containing protein [Treponema sp.]